MRSAPGFSELVFYAKRFVPSYVMWGTCISTASGPGMSNTSPQGYFIKRLHGLGGIIKVQLGSRTKSSES